MRTEKYLVEGLIQACRKHLRSGATKIGRVNWVEQVIRNTNDLMLGDMAEKSLSMIESLSEKQKGDVTLLTQLQGETVLNIDTDEHM